MIRKLIFAALMMVTSASSFATQYITNGTFNDPSADVQIGWTVNSASSFFVDNIYYEGAITETGAGTLTQTISGATGPLILSFDLIIGEAFAQFTSTFESVIFDGVTLGAYTNGGAQSLSFNVVGTGHDTLVFRGINQADYNQISNVSLTEAANAVPEPGSYALMALGLGLLGFMARRKRA